MRRTQLNIRGFSLVELLAVVLILAVLASVAVPLYVNTRRASAARSCKANITAIAAAESTFVLRNGQFCLTPMAQYNAGNPTAGGLVGDPEGLVSGINCPWDGAAYLANATATGGLSIACPHCATAQGGDGSHETVSPSPDGFGNYYRVLSAPASDQ